MPPLNFYIMCTECESNMALIANNLPEISTTNTRINLVFRTDMSPSDATSEIQKILAENFKGFTLDRLAVDLW